MYQRLLSLSGLIVFLNLVTVVIGHPITLPGQDLQTRANGQKDKPVTVPSPPPKTGGKSPAPTGKDPKTPAEAEHGSYMVMSPHDQFMIWDNKYSSFLTYLKIGDTRTDNRDRAYSTHNPSIIYKARKDQKKASGKTVEYSTLRKLAEAFGTKPDDSGIVQRVGTTYSRVCEWYEIYLGQDHKKAALAKKALRDMLKQYGEEATDKFSYGGAIGINLN